MLVFFFCENTFLVFRSLPSRQECPARHHGREAFGLAIAKSVFIGIHSSCWNQRRRRGQRGFHVWSSPLFHPGAFTILNSSYWQVEWLGFGQSEQQIWETFCSSVYKIPVSGILMFILFQEHTVKNHYQVLCCTAYLPARRNG